MTNFVQRQKAQISAAIDAQTNPLIVRGQVKPFTNFVNQRLNASRPTMLSNVHGAAAVHVRASCRRLRNAGKQLFDGLHVRDQHGPEAHRKVVQEFSMSFDFGEAGKEVGIHGQSPDSVDAVKRIASLSVPHCLSGGAK